MNCRTKIFFNCIKGYSAARLFLIAFFVLTQSMVCVAQKNDFQAWFEITGSAKLNKAWTIELSNETRLRENASIISKNFTDLGVIYGINKHWDAGLFLRHTVSEPMANTWTSSQRVYADLRWKTNAKKRLQIGFRLRIGSENESNETNAFEWNRREKLSVEYELKKVGLSPFGSLELFSPLRLRSNFEKIRVFAGLEFKLAKLHQISLAYGMQHNFTNANNDYIIVFGYKYKIKFKKK